MINPINQLGENFLWRAHIQPQLGLALAFIRTVTLKTMGGKDGPHIALEIDFAIRSGNADKQHDDPPMNH